MKYWILIPALLVYAACAYAQPVFTLSKSEIQFANTAIQATSRETFDVTNNTDDMLFLSPHIGGPDSNAFELFMYDSVTLSAHSTVGFGVKFTPTAARTYTATVLIGNRETGTITTLDLSGTGDNTLPHVSITPSSFYTSTWVGETKSVTVTLRNTSVNAAHLELSGGGPINFTTNTDIDDITLDGNQSLDIVFSYTPQQVGIYADSLNWRHSEANDWVWLFMSGQAIAPATAWWNNDTLGNDSSGYTIDVADPNTPITNTYRLTNGGNDVENFRIISTNPRFMVSATSVAIEPGEYADIEVTYTSNGSSYDYGVVSAMYSQGRSADLRFNVRYATPQPQELGTFNKEVVRFDQSVQYQYATFTNTSDTVYTVSFVSSDDDWTVTPTEAILGIGERVVITVMAPQDIDWDDSIHANIDAYMGSRLIDRLTIWNGIPDRDTFQTGIRVRATDIHGTVGSTATVRLIAMNEIPADAATVEVSVRYNPAAVTPTVPPMSEVIDGANRIARMSYTITNHAANAEFAAIPFSILSADAAKYQIQFPSFTWKKADGAAMEVGTTVNGVTTTVEDEFNAGPLTMSVTPNPATSAGTLNIGGNVEHGMVTIIDVRGTVVYSVAVAAGATDVLSIGMLPSGSYTVRFSSGINTVVRQLIKL